MDHVGASLKRKLGPLPVWGWAVISGVILYYVRNRSSSSSGGGILGGLLGGTSTGNSTGSSTGTLSSGAAEGGSGDYSALSNEVAQLEKKVAAETAKIKKQQGTIAKLRKKLKKKPKSKTKTKTKARVVTKPKKAVVHTAARVPARSGSVRRNRTTVTTTTGATTKPRGGILPRRGVSSGVRPPSVRSVARAGETAATGASSRAKIGLGGVGGSFRHRPAAPSAQGSVRRNRAAAGPATHSVQRETPAPAKAKTPARTPAPRHQAAAKTGRKR